MSCRFKAGLVLEREVSKYLKQLGINHRQTENRGEEDVVDQIDFIVSPGSGRGDLEIQLTLRPKQKNKIFDFAYRALTTTVRGIRLYIEVVGSHSRSADLAVVAKRVACAIKLIMQRFRNFGSDMLLGLRIHAKSGKIEKFDLLKFCGDKLLKIVNTWKQEQRRLHEERLAAEQAAFRERMHAPKPSPFWRGFLKPVTDLVHTYVAPNRQSASVDTRHFFMPRRLC